MTMMKGLSCLRKQKQKTKESYTTLFFNQGGKLEEGELAVKNSSIVNISSTNGNDSRAM